MIGKIPDKRRDGHSSFRDLVAYCASKDPSKVIHVGYQNVLSPETAALEMEALATDNKRCKDPVFHAILSWREMEIPTPEQADEAVRIALKELNLEDCQALWVLQNDTQNRHVHIIANRIDPETGKAITPANGWTYKALERAARNIEIIQGWESEQSGFYSVTENGEIVEKKRRKEPAISTSAKDGEAHTAITSAERIVQETAAPVTRAIKSWEELHEKLAAHGIAFDRKGSGAVLMIDGIVVKASKAGRDISMSKLEARLGEYRQRPVNIPITKRQTEPVARVNERKVKNNWERYTEAREKYFAAKRKATADLLEWQKEERAALKQTQTVERENTFSVSWKGRGGLLNRTRSVIAATQKTEKLNLRDRHGKERGELKKRFPSRFPNFKTWLDTAENDKEALIAFRYPRNGILTDPSEGNKNAAAFDLRAFSPTLGNKGGVAYKTQDSNEARFVDYGKIIVLSEKCDETAILAALQLANQKWGSAVVNGTEEYKRACVELAIKHNLKIYNPDLAKEVEEGRKRMTQRNTGEAATMQTTEKADKKAIFTRYAGAVGAERFRATVTEIGEGGTSAFIFDKKNGGYEGKTKEEILEAIPKFTAYSRYNKNIIVTPISSDRHHILVDDLTPEKLKQLRDDGYRPSCVIETSPDNFQAILTVLSEEGDSEKDRIAANKLTRDLNVKYGDPKLSGSVHGHRMPPFSNQKPKHRREDGTYPDTVLIEANGGFCWKAGKELKTIHASLKEAEEKAKRRDEKTKNVSEGQSAGFTGANDPNGAYWIHYRDIAAKFTGTTDYSRIDGMVGVRMRVTGYTREQIREAIESNAPAMRRESMTEQDFGTKYKNKDWPRYARETADNFVFGLRGLSQYESARKYRPRLMKLEGRDFREEARREYARRAEQDRQDEQISGR
ncbi:MAG: relaxase/mobilization nuclease domain-containing protein [Synergistaceae bacterium]|nr:relaxase/mobilization nuclease domain-containing protein [Synergistaceae bacterium]